MRPSNLLHLYRLRLRARLVQELLAVLGIAVGVALLFAASVANTSLTGSVERLTSGLVGDARFQLAARSPDGFDEELVKRVQGIPGVRAAAPLLDARATVVGPSGSASVDLVGADARFARLGGSLLRPFSSGRLARQRALGLPASIAREVGASIGQEVAVELAGYRIQATVGAVLHREDIGDLVDSPVAVAPLSYAQEIARLSDRVTRVYVVPEPGMDRAVEQGLQTLAGDRLSVRPARFDVRLFEKAAMPTSASTALFSALSAGIGFLFAFSAMLLTVPQRRRMIADLRVDGYGQAVLQVLLLDALLLGAVASLLGLALGDVLSRVLLAPTPGYLAYTFPIGSQRIVTVGSVALALAGGLLAASAAVLSPYGSITERSNRRRPRGVARWAALAVGGLAAVGGTTLILVVAPELALLGMALLTAGLLLLLGPVMALLLQLLDRVARTSRDAAPFMALVQLRSRPNRLRAGAIAATGAIAVLSSVAIQGAREDLQRGLDAAVRDIDSTADVWVTAAGTSNTFATSALRVPAPAGLAQVDGVAAVRSYRGGFLDWDDRRVWVLAPPRDAAQLVPTSQLAEPGDARVAGRIRAGGWAVLSHAVADAHGLGVGDGFVLPAPVPIRLRVAALSSNLGWPPGAVIVNAEDYASAWGSPAASAYQLMLSPGTRPEAVRSSVQSILGPDAALLVETSQQRQERHYASTRDALSRLSQIRTLALIAAVLATATAMGGLVWQRRSKLARMKVDGFTDAELWRALVLESALLLGAGAVLGAAFGLYGQLLLSRALERITGFPVVFSLATATAVESVVLFTAVAVVIVAIPGYLVARVEPEVAQRD